ncbi:MAG: cupin domain-containing protein [Smithellaceae bacterium]
MKRYFWGCLCFLFLAVFPAVAAEYDTGVSGRVIVASETTSNGQPVRYPKNGEGKITVMEVTIAPGAETGWHQHPVPVYAYMLSGTLTVRLADGKTLDFKEGDAIIEVVDTPHNGFNKGTAPVKLIVFYTGVKGVPNVVRMDKP